MKKCENLGCRKHEISLKICVNQFNLWLIELLMRFDEGFWRDYLELGGTE